MVYKVTLSSELFPGFPESDFMLPDHWRTYATLAANASKAWTDPTFSDSEYSPMLALFFFESSMAPEPERLNRWSPLLLEDTVPQRLDNFIYSRELCFRDAAGTPREAYLACTVSREDPTRVWEVQSILESLRKSSDL